MMMQHKDLKSGENSVAAEDGLGRYWRDQGRHGRAVDRAMRRVGLEPADRLRWLVDLAQRDDRQGIGERVRQTLALEIYAFVLLMRGSIRQQPALPAQEIAALTGKLRAGLDALLNGREWNLPADRGLVRQLRRLTQSRSEAHEHGFDTKVFSSYDGPLAAMVLWAAADLVASEGHRLARCARGGCERPIFVRERPDQAYCSKRCSLLERTRRYRTETPREQLSEARHRLYVRRVARELEISEEAAAKKVRRRTL